MRTKIAAHSPTKSCAVFLFMPGGHRRALLFNVKKRCYEVYWYFFRVSGRAIFSGLPECEVRAGRDGADGQHLPE